MIRLVKRTGRINKEMKDLIEIVRVKMVETFGLNIQIIINNKMSYKACIEIEEYSNGEVEKFGNIYLRTTQTTYSDLIRSICHEFAHINFPNCHDSKNKQSTNEDVKHAQLTRKLHLKVIEELKQENIVY